MGADRILRSGFGLLLVCVGCQLGHGPAPVVPQRATLSSDTGTTHPQTFELEGGVGYDPDSAWNTPVDLKYGLDDTSEVSVGWAPVQWNDLQGQDHLGVGDVTLGMRHRFLEEEGWRPSAAFQLVGLLPSGDGEEGLGAGAPGLFAAGMVTSTLGRVTTTLFYEVALLGEANGGGIDVEHALAASAGLPLNHTWGAFGELAGIIAPERDASPLFANVGVTHAFAPWLVMDSGVLIGLNGDAQDLIYRVGFTMNFGGPAPHAHGH